MIRLSEINTVSDRFRVPSEIIEKDYVISWVLTCLSKSNLKKHFIFYGGTAIKRIYFEDHRFSEDIDLLSSNHFQLDYLLEELNSLKYAAEEANLILEINQDKIMSTKDLFNYLFTIQVMMKS